MLPARLGRGRVQRAVDVREQRARLVVVAVVDVGARGGRTGRAVALGDEGMARRNVVDIGDVGLGDAGRAVERHGRIDHGRCDGKVLGAREDVDPIARQARERVDCALLRKLLGAPQQMRRVGRPVVGLHAAIERGRELPLGAAVRAARDDAGADHRRGEGDVELARHEGAGRQARDRGLREIDVEGGQLGRERAGPRERRDEDDEASSQSAHRSSAAPYAAMQHAAARYRRQARLNFRAGLGWRRDRASVTCEVGEGAPDADRAV